MKETQSVSCDVDGTFPISPNLLKNVGNAPSNSLEANDLHLGKVRPITFPDAHMAGVLLHLLNFPKAA